MDPLSITASIVGILAAAGKLSELLSSIISTTKDAPQVANALVGEINDIQAALSSLQIFLRDLSASPQRRTALIQLDQLIVTFTESVLTFSELESIMSPFAATIGERFPLRARIRWARVEGSCMKIVERLQRHKSSISLMLNILQCATDAEADRSQASLQMLIEQLLDGNKELCKRLKNLEDAFDARSTITNRLESLSLISRGDDETITIASQPTNKRITILEAIKVRFAFDADLESSRVYRHARNSECDASFASSAIRTHAWSIFSGLSLADISVISVVALPLYPDDLTNQQYYTFGDSDTPTSEVDALWTNSQAVVTIPSGHSHDTWPLPAAHIPDREYIYGTPIQESASQNSRLAQQSGTFEDGLKSYYHKTNDLGSIEALESSLSSMMKSQAGSSDYEVIPELEDVVFHCKGCGEILEEGKAFELASNRWHIDCFRCNTCGTLLDSDANLLLLGDGALICNNCTYSCNHCGEKIEDLAVLTGDQAFCANCFRCRNCKRKIENLRYARTSQGIFCESCHESLMARRRKKSRESPSYQLKPLPPEPVPGPLRAPGLDFF